MITYDKSAYGVNLLLRIHGSAAYRSVVPGLLGVACLLFFRYLRNIRVYGIGQTWDYYTRGDDDLQHPYAVGVLVTATTFLMVFRCTQGYNRYWEATSAIHQMMSKWMDATIHTGCYHMQCAHYDSIKPPSFFDYPELNAYYLTRDRERFYDPKDDGVDATYNAEEDQVGGLQEEEEAVEEEESNPAVEDDNHGNIGDSSSYDEPSSRIQRRTTGSSAASGHSVDSGTGTSGRSAMTGLSERAARHRAVNFESSRPNPVLDRAVLKSISAVKVKDPATLTKRIDRIKKKYSNDRPTSPTRPGRARLGDPTPLTGTPRLDGNWSALFNDRKATFYSKRDTDPSSPDFLNNLPNFASLQGGRTPPLFLQELAHLCSLMNAVALSTLRNDMEGSVSPLGVYKPGSPWPEVDPDKVASYYLNGSLISRFGRQVLYFFGFMRTDEERTRYNAARPLPVLGGVSDAEIVFLQMARGPSAKTQLCWYWLTEFIIREHLNGSTGKVGPPIISRIIQFLSDGMIFYNHGRKIMFIPFPFAHAQLAVMFVIVMIPAVAFLMDQYSEDVIVGSILCFFSVACISGIHEVARELENPFRNVPNELPLMTLQAQFNEALLVMFSGYHPDHFWDPSSHKHHPSDPPPKTNNQIRRTFSGTKAPPGRKGATRGSVRARNTPTPSPGSVSPMPKSSVISDPATPQQGNMIPIPNLPSLATPGSDKMQKAPAVAEAKAASSAQSTPAASNAPIVETVKEATQPTAPAVPPAETKAVPAAVAPVATNATTPETSHNGTSDIAQMKEMLESYGNEIERLKVLLEAATAEKKTN